MTRNRHTARFTAAAVLVLLAAGCGGSSSPGPGALRPSPSATSSTASTAPASASASPSDASTEARAVYYLADDGGGPRLYREFHRRPVQSTPTAKVKDAVEAMLTSPAQDSDYTSLWSRQTIVRGVRITGTTAYVDLSSQARTANAGGASENASVQQLVHTVTAAANDVRGVQLLIEGKQATDLWGHVDVSKPVSRQPAAEILAPVWITTPDDGSLRTGGTFGGEATVFEATVSWELLQGGDVVKRGFTTASIGAPGRGSWTDTADVPAGNYVLRAFESSAKDGSPRWVDDKPLRVTG